MYVSLSWTDHNHQQNFLNQLTSSEKNVCQNKWLVIRAHFHITPLRRMCFYRRNVWGFHAKVLLGWTFGPVSHVVTMWTFMGPNVFWFSFCNEHGEILSWCGPVLQESTSDGLWKKICMYVNLSVTHADAQCQELQVEGKFSWIWNGDSGKLLPSLRMIRKLVLLSDA